VNLVNVLLLGLFLLVLGLTLPQKPKYIKFLHLVGALYITILLFITPYNTNVKHFRMFSPERNKIPLELPTDPSKLYELQYK
jgi:NhaP-type Na+/H+ or K+/H+ antiporter